MFVELLGDFMTIYMHKNVNGQKKWIILKIKCRLAVSPLKQLINSIV